MIPRYSRPEASFIWSDTRKFEIMLEIELLVCEALEKQGIAPQGSSKTIREKAFFNVDEIAEIEKEVKHDVIAFLTCVSSKLGDESRFLHYGMTSSDVLDTCMSVRLRESALLISEDLEQVIGSLIALANKGRGMRCMGRSHGMHAEPTTFGIKMLRFVKEFERAKQRLEFVMNEISVCKISGVVGTYSQLDPTVEEYVANRLNMKVESVASQVVARDRHAMFMSILAITACSIENFAVEIRHLQRTEVSEVREGFSVGQKGSSAMPHKRNPILSENLTGLARMIRAMLMPTMENVALWHERDISHSSVERMAIPDACVNLDFALHRMKDLINNLELFPERMLYNISVSGETYLSQRALLILVETGMHRDEAYKIVQRNAIEAIDGSHNFVERISKDTGISEKVLREDSLSSIEDLLFNRSLNNYIQ